MSAMSSWPAADRKYGVKSKRVGAPRHGGRRVGKFNDMQDQITKMTQHERVLWHREERRKREEKARTKKASETPR